MFASFFIKKKYFFSFMSVWVCYLVGCVFYFNTVKSNVILNAYIFFIVKFAVANQIYLHDTV